MENGSSSEGKDPSAFLGEIIGAPVIVKLNSGVVYKGTTFNSSVLEYDWGFLGSNTLLGELQSVDGYMNIALEKTEEFVNGKLRRNYGDAFVRGNNGSFHFVLLFSLMSMTDMELKHSALHLRKLKGYSVPIYLRACEPSIPPKSRPPNLGVRQLDVFLLSDQILLPIPPTMFELSPLLKTRIAHLVI